MKTFADYSTGRDNNLNLIRFIAAGAVLVSHAVPITRGISTPEPLYALTGHSLGSLAVYVFFVISGFLITASFERSSSRTSFTVARILRLMPGLIVSLLLVALVLGPLVTRLDMGGYFEASGPYIFILRNTLLFPLEFRLPGVFEGQPVEAAVGSIWTLRHEVLCYIGVFVAGVAGLLATRWRAGITLGAYLLGWLGLALSAPDLPALAGPFLRLSMPFAIGIGFWIWRDRLPLNAGAVAVAILLAWLLRGTVASYPAFALALGYATFWLGYVPGGAIRGFNRLGDYSYGVYVYAFPLQGLAVHLFGPQTPLENVAHAALPTLILAVLSWHLIEAPAMTMKPAILNFLGRGRPDAAPVDPKGPPGDAVKRP